MFIKLNDRVCLNLSRITRTKIDSEATGVRVHFFEGQMQVAKSQRFEKVKDAQKWLTKLLKSSGLY